MKTRFLIIIGIVFASAGLGSLAYVTSVQNQCDSLLGDTRYPRPLTFWNCLDYLRMIEPIPESPMESGPIEITGVINHWEPIDGPAYALISEEPVNAQVSNPGIFLYGDMLRPHMKDKTVTVKGTFIPNYVEYKASLGLRLFGGDPRTATILVDEIQINSESQIFQMESQTKNIECAVEYDKIMSISSCPPRDDGAICEPVPVIDRFIFPDKANESFRKMHCADIVDNWSYLPEHLEGLMDGQIDWNLVSAIHHEKPTFDIYGLNEKFQPIKVGQKIRLSVSYWDEIDCSDYTVKITDKLTGDTVYDKQYHYDCKSKDIERYGKMMLRPLSGIDYRLSLPGEYVFEMINDDMKISEEFFVECTSGGCEFLTDEQLEGRQTYRLD